MGRGLVILIVLGQLSPLSGSLTRGVSVKGSPRADVFIEILVSGCKAGILAEFSK